MTKRIAWRLTCGIVVALLLGPGNVLAQVATNRLVFRQQGLYGADEMDWENKRIRVTAVGTYDPDEIASEGDKMILAQEQAELLAREKLVAMNYGVWITGLSSVSTRYTTAEARLLCSGIVRDAKVEKVEFKQMDDGSLLAVATMSAPMLKPGDLLSGAGAWQGIRAKVEDEVRGVRDELGIEAPPARVLPKPMPPREDPVVEALPEVVQEKLEEAIREDVAGLKPEKPEPARVEERYTGLIVDVSGVPNARVTMLPRIVDETDRRIYGVEDLPPSAMMNSEVVQYASSLENAKKLPQAGSNPMVIKALRVSPYNPGHIVLANPAGAEVMGAEVDGAFLRQGKVVLVF